MRENGFENGGGVRFEDVVQRRAFNQSYATLLAREDAILLVAGGPGGEVVGYLLATSHPAFHANGPVVWVEEVMVAAGARAAAVLACRARKICCLRDFG